MRLIIINGVMGVGKSVTSRALNQKLSNSVWLDGDWCWMMDPFVVNDITKEMVIDNITYQLNNFINSKQFEHIIFNWVIDEEYIYDEVIKRLAPIDIYKITLMCSKETLSNRINQDIKAGLRDEDNLNRSLSKYQKYQDLNSIKIDTDNKQIDTIIKEIEVILED